MKKNKMKSNEQLQRDVLDAIRWEPMLKPILIAVTAKDGVVKLSGDVDSYARKTEICQVTKQVVGVLEVVELIEVIHGEKDTKSDLEIMDEVAMAFYWNQYVPVGKISVKVDKGHVRLDGELTWHYERQAAQQAAAHVDGIKGLTNNIRIVSEAADQIEKKGIEEALARNWAVSEGNIAVKVSGNEVTLTGKVDSIYQKEEAERISWNAPGVWTVNNRIQVRGQGQGY